ncbi:hypothetical protein Bca4012_066630 [Brassica carinata]
MLVGLRLSCSWCVVTLKACGGPIRICGSATGEVVFLLALSGCEVASEAPEEPIHSPIAYLDWIWRGSTSTLSFATMPSLSCHDWFVLESLALASGFRNPFVGYSSAAMIEQFLVLVASIDWEFLNKTLQNSLVHWLIGKSEKGRLIPWWFSFQLVFTLTKNPEPRKFKYLVYAFMYDQFGHVLYIGMND